VGYESGEALYKSAARENITIGDVEIPAALVRVGERGVLFVVVNDRKTRFARWDDIKKIETVPK